MNNNEQIQQLIEEALSSADGANRARPRPFLFTRIQARMAKTTETVWDKAIAFISRPAVAFAAICFVVLLNAWVIVYNKPADTPPTDLMVQNTTDEFGYTANTLFDIDNTQP